ncbi:hypothetical protein GWI33_014680 [Rhynchophorus ferrugineus]|uniref:Uncharacterized protein n=1 Tax=Rhynchophorus ferrugineus TaxID=354439 RepID=A0A834M6M9_RHYFE|nr:hypothetical protein GWI33_014680 [Rhynchophorus ferrugineus]
MITEHLTIVVPIFSLICIIGFVQNQCLDPNSEQRNDNSNCVATCQRKNLLENPKFCFEKNLTLKLDCYCKTNYYYDESTKKCVEFMKCPCNIGNNEVSRFANKCGTDCTTMYNRNCTPVLTWGCWCSREYCRNEQGACIPIE